MPDENTSPYHGVKGTTYKYGDLFYVSNLQADPIQQICLGAKEAFRPFPPNQFSTLPSVIKITAYGGRRGGAG